MSQNIRGWRKVNGEMLEQTAARWPQNHQFNLGFRLVHDSTIRVFRGGSWDNTADYAQSAVRDGDVPGYHEGLLGLRLVWDRP